MDFLPFALLIRNFVNEIPSVVGNMHTYTIPFLSMNYECNLSNVSL